ncbi:hypothetical protein A3J90_08660 [candidate division WOR-1 bacterium RIFOXYC2_FULL_37_10]|uniref:AB hydrolase-1 domain-containing protein n=1 Tax=candidate division WOR-1 bacterium RIFOXYB2_FULL_37_13 TaxID=1802579 RepID=A0A1F4SNJ8_UNCSA|nr:MAG: hypothetical protein A2246_06865 [candidate division WOR-1 bacterium RIFOXYA2_FULL_37_7]OGC22018.1 MAG: hypothetical protein A2310_06940 [candidate division WOR-1 bacterium RIFOXYB2_FULL_37_13]OGC33046.1 MAG: hypothetical protein A3J90_08660 [candidate division WOR-1 bacterium RIFOXYC2_FULL_37_10]
MDNLSVTNRFFYVAPTEDKKNNLTAPANGNIKVETNNNSYNYSITTYSPQNDTYPNYGIIFLGGAWHNVRNYNDYFTSIAEDGAKVVAIPYPGHEGAPKISKKAFKDISLYDYATATAENIAEIIRSDPTRKWVIVAHSMGSLVAKEALADLHKNNTDLFDTNIAGVLLQQPAGPKFRAGAIMAGFFVSQIPKLPSKEVKATDRQISNMFFNGGLPPVGFNLQSEPLNVVIGCIGAVLKYKRSEGFFGKLVYVFEADQDNVVSAGTGGDIISFCDKKQQPCFLKTVEGGHEYAVTKPKEAATFTVGFLDFLIEQKRTKQK